MMAPDDASLSHAYSHVALARRSYEGEWVDGKINGQGTLWYADGDQYQGEWRDGKMHGRGTYTYADGDQYEGDWKDDRRHGKGTVTYAAVEGGASEKREKSATTTTTTKEARTHSKAWEGRPPLQPWLSKAWAQSINCCSDRDRMLPNSNA